MELPHLIELLKRNAELAVTFDSKGNKEAAIYYYLETVSQINIAKNLNKENAVDLTAFISKAHEYSSRAEALKTEADQAAIDSAKRAQTASGEFERAKFCLVEALELDENGNEEEAVELYTKAVELCIKAKKETTDDSVKAKLGKVARQALERAEQIRGRVREEPPSAELGATALPPKPKQRVIPPLGIEGLNLNEKTETPVRRAAAPASGYSEEEKKVLAKTSLINGREYVPFLNVDLKERFAFPMPFNDKDGLLALAPKQKAKLVKWARPEEFMSNPCVVYTVDCFSVKQTVVSDCSFVASIAISAQYEKKFGKKLITPIIYPQDRNGTPVYNPCGKYMVKLRINGVTRKVVIDDRFPLGPHGEPLCSYSSNRNELWISILEKAYMKVMGGYDFPGSNSNIDLYALTGWIPERISIKLNDPKAFDKDAVFRKLLDRFHKGHVLVTMATGEMSDAQADRAGLVPTHAYAMLDIREVKGVRLFLLKNPWSHLRWRGNYSELDAQHWTADMQKALNYDPKNAKNFDNGVFWIDYDSLCNFYDVIYMNWNPTLFSHTYAIHDMWNAGVGPAKDMYNISSNPQFSLELNKSGSGALWILLSRHITDIDDFRNNKEYITVLVYKNDGRKVYYPFDPPPFIDGVRINSPHYLCQTTIKEDTPRKMTLVVSQYEKSTTIYFTLRIYSTLPFTMKRIGDPYKYEQKVTCAWKGSLAGGCANNVGTYMNNPRFQFKVDSECGILVELRGPKEYQIGFDIICVVAGDSKNSRYFKKKNSGPYRSGFVIMTTELTAGTYDVVPSTFYPGQEAAFFMTVRCTVPTKVSRLK